MHSFKARNNVYETLYVASTDNFQFSNTMNFYCFMPVLLNWQLSSLFWHHLKGFQLYLILEKYRNCYQCWGFVLQTSSIQDNFLRFLIFRYLVAWCDSIHASLWHRSISRGQRFRNLDHDYGLQILLSKSHFTKL